MHRRQILKGFGIAGLFGTIAQSLFAKSKFKEPKLFEPGTLVVTITELDTGEVIYRDTLTAPLRAMELHIGNSVMTPSKFSIVDY